MIALADAAVEQSTATHAREDALWSSSRSIAAMNCLAIGQMVDFADTTTNVQPKVLPLVRGATVSKGYSMHIFSIVAHPRSNSFCHAVSATAQSWLTSAGHTIEHHDLYAEKFDPCLTAEEAYTVGDTLEETLLRVEDPVLREHRSSIARAEGLLVVHPNWWGKPPAVLAGWLDRVLVPGVAYRLETADGLPDGLLSIRTALIFNTSDTDAEREVNDLGDPLELIWGRCVLPYCGINSYERSVFRPVVGSSPTQRDRWLEETEAKCHSSFGLVDQ